MTANERLIEVIQEINRVQNELLTQTRNHIELVKAHERKIQELEASGQMLMGVAFAVTGERVAAERSMACALLSDPKVSTAFASYWPESQSALEAARTWRNQPQANSQPDSPSSINLDELTKHTLLLLKILLKHKNV